MQEADMKKEKSTPIVWFTQTSDIGSAKIASTYQGDISTD